jgi:hypothetical protein
MWEWRPEGNKMVLVAGGELNLDGERQALQEGYQRCRRGEDEI